MGRDIHGQEFHCQKINNINDYVVVLSRGGSLEDENLSLPLILTVISAGTPATDQEHKFRQYILNIIRLSPSAAFCRPQHSGWESLWDEGK